MTKLTTKACAGHDVTYGDVIMLSHPREQKAALDSIDERLRIEILLTPFPSFYRHGSPVYLATPPLQTFWQWNVVEGGQCTYQTVLREVWVFFELRSGLMDCADSQLCKLSACGFMLPARMSKVLRARRHFVMSF